MKKENTTNANRTMTFFILKYTKLPAFTGRLSEKRKNGEVTFVSLYQTCIRWIARELKSRQLLSSH
jgi:hypothetical protein